MTDPSLIERLRNIANECAGDRPVTLIYSDIAALNKAADALAANKALLSEAERALEQITQLSLPPDLGQELNVLAFEAVRIARTALAKLKARKAQI